VKRLTVGKLPRRVRARETWRAASVLIGLATVAVLSGCVEGQTPEGTTDGEQTNSALDNLAWNWAKASCDRDVRCQFIDADQRTDCTSNLALFFAEELIEAEDAGLERVTACEEPVVETTRDLACDATEDELNCALVSCRTVIGTGALGDACAEDTSRDDCGQGLFCSGERICVDPCAPSSEPEETGATDE